MSSPTCSSAGELQARGVTGSYPDNEVCHRMYRDLQAAATQYASVECEGWRGGESVTPAKPSGDSAPAPTLGPVTRHAGIHRPILIEVIKHHLHRTLSR